MKKKPIVFGVAGGTGSGKTTVAENILAMVGAEQVAYLAHDSYYSDASHLSFTEREKINFDHPDSLETELLVAHVNQLLAGNSIELPIYDFSIHGRKKETVTVEPASIIIDEGILIFIYPELRQLMDIKVFVDTDADVRFIRRMQRDVAARPFRRIRRATIPRHRTADAPRICRTQQTVRRCHHPRRRP